MRAPSARVAPELAAATVQMMDEGTRAARIPSRTLALAPTDNGRLAPERAAGISLREAPVVPLCRGFVGRRRQGRGPLPRAHLRGRYN